MLRRADKYSRAGLLQATEELVTHCLAVVGLTRHALEVGKSSLAMNMIVELQTTLEANRVAYNQLSHIENHKEEKPMAILTTETRRLLDTDLVDAYRYATRMTERLKSAGIEAMQDGDTQLAAKAKHWRSLLREIVKGVGPRETSGESGLADYARRGCQRQGWPEVG